MVGVDATKESQSFKAFRLEGMVEEHCVVEWLSHCDSGGSKNEWDS